MPKPLALPVMEMVPLGAGAAAVVPWVTAPPPEMGPESTSWPPRKAALSRPAAPKESVKVGAMEMPPLSTTRS